MMRYVETIAPVHALLIYFDATVTTLGSLSDVAECPSDDVRLCSTKSLHSFLPAGDSDFAPNIVGISKYELYRVSTKMRNLTW